MNIITRGFGQYQKIIARGYSETITPQKDIYAPRAMTKTKEYQTDISIPIYIQNHHNLEIYSPIIRTSHETISLIQPILISKEEQLIITASVDNQRLKLIYDILKVI